jgi:hypothetical protein
LCVLASSYYSVPFVGRPGNVFVRETRFFFRDKHLQTDGVASNLGPGLVDHAIYLFNKRKIIGVTVYA